MHTIAHADALIRMSSFADGGNQGYLFASDMPLGDSSQHSAGHSGMRHGDGRKYRLVAVEKPEIGLTYCEQDYDIVE